jgi:hypothetical protein
MVTSLVGLAASATSDVASTASATDFPSGTLVTGERAVHGEDVATGGVVSSGVPPESRVVAVELLVTVRPHDQAPALREIRSEKGASIVGTLMHLAVELRGVAPSASDSDSSAAVFAGRSCI